MKRILYDVSLWHLMLHREHRGLPKAKPSDDRQRLIEDEVFEVLYAGEGSPAPKEDVNAALAPWAERFHTACRQLPHFQRLADDCRGDAGAAAVAVESLMDDLSLSQQAPLPPKVTPGAAKDPLRRPLQAACDNASADVELFREARDGLSGLSFPSASGPGGATGASTDITRAREIQSRLRTNPSLKRIAQLAGRFKRIAAVKRRQRVRHGADEIADIEQGADLARTLPSELAKLHHPLLRKTFLRSLLERQVLQYQLVGSETLASGPLIVALDKSTSMDDCGRAEWAAAVTLALHDHAAEQKRPFGLLTFSDRVIGETLVAPGHGLPWEALTVRSENATDISCAVARGLDIIGAGPQPFRKADLVLVTDGGSDSAEAPALRARAQSLQTTVFGVAIGMPEGRLAPWCDIICSTNTMTSLDPELVTNLFAA